MMLRTLFVFLIAVLLGAAAPVAAEEKPPTLTLIVTGNADRLFPVMTNEPPVPDPRAAWVAAIRAAKEENPDALLVDAGNNVSISNGLETGYSYKFPVIFQELGFSAAAMSGRDAALNAAHNAGYRTIKPEFLKPVIANVTSPWPDPLPVPVALAAESPNGAKARFIAMATKRAASALSGRLETCNEVPAADVAEQIAMARANGEISIGFSSMDDTDTSPVFALAKGSTDVMVDFNKSALEPVEKSKTGAWHIPVPEPGELLVLKIEGEAGKIAKAPVVERRRWLAPEHWDKLIKLPTPDLGIGIGNISRVIEAYLTTEPVGLSMERVSAKDYKDLTKRAEIEHYLLHMQGKDYRVYRFQSMMPNWNAPGMSDGGWPQVDMIVLLTADHRFFRAFNRSQIAIGALPTRLLDALNTMTGTDLSEGRPDPRLIAGGEEVYEWVRQDVRKVIELDRRIYGKAAAKPE